jgi:hypothetical protein
MALAGRGDGTDVIHVGDFIHFPWASTKTFSSYPELSGDVACVEWLPFLTGIVLRGTRPGTLTIKVFRKFWKQTELEFAKEWSLKIVD